MIITEWEGLITLVQEAAEPFPQCHDILLPTSTITRVGWAGKGVWPENTTATTTITSPIITNIIIRTQSRTIKTQSRTTTGTWNRTQYLENRNPRLGNLIRTFPILTTTTTSDLIIIRIVMATRVPVVPPILVSSIGVTSLARTQTEGLRLVLTRIRLVPVPRGSQRNDWRRVSTRRK